ncbi:hypothetical protein ACRRTK_010584 [Alexandromys fortis]
MEPGSILALQIPTVICRERLRQNSSTSLYELNSSSEAMKEIKLKQVSKFYDGEECIDIRKTYWRQHYFSDLLNTLDAVVTGVTLLIAMAVMFYEKKFLRDVPMTVITPLSHVSILAERQAYLAEDKFMGPEVVRFLDTKHPDHYQVYNLCSMYTAHFSVSVDREQISFADSSPTFYLFESLYFFGERRTDKTTSSKFQGIETPSQMFHDVETDRVIINVFNCPALYDDVKVKFLSPRTPQIFNGQTVRRHTAKRDNRVQAPKRKTMALASPLPTGNQSYFASIQTCSDEAPLSSH